MKTDRLLGFDRNVFWMGVTSFFTDMGSEMIYPLLPIFLSSVLGVNKAFIGLIEGIAEATASLLKVASGWFSDKIGKRKEITVFGYSLSTIAKPLLAVSTAGWHVLFLRFLDRLGKGLRGAPRDALIAESCESCDRGKSFGFHRAMDTAGAIAGPALAFILLPLLNNDFRSIFLISAIPAAIAVLVLIIYVRETGHQIQDTKTQTNTNYQSIKAPINGKFVLFTAVFTLFTLGNSSDAFIILRATDMKIAVFLIPVLWMLFNSIYTIACIPAGKLSDKIGRKTVLVAGLLVYSLVYFGFARAGSAWQIWMLFAFYGIYYGITEGVSRAFIADLVPSQNRATAYGIFGTSTGIAVFFASVIMGSLWQTFGASVAFSFGGSLALASALLLMVFL